MYCPTCGNPDSAVLDSRRRDGSIARRRECNNAACRHRFNTREIIDHDFAVRPNDNAPPSKPTPDDMSLPAGASIPGQRVPAQLQTLPPAPKSPPPLPFTPPKPKKQALPAGRMVDTVRQTVDTWTQKG